MKPPPGGPVREPTVAVLLCDRLERIGGGLDLEAIRLRLEREDRNLHVEVIADLCGRPRELRRAAAAGAQRVVLGVCAREGGEVEMQQRARRLGLDPFAVRRLNLGGLCACQHPSRQATTKSALLLSAAVARARAYAGCGPESLRPHLAREGQKISRRALFTLPPLVYQPIASVHQERCAARAGCRLCAEVCPRDALTRDGGRIGVDASACDACGICVMECPRSAIDLAGQWPGELEAELRALLCNQTLEAFAPRAPLFVCDRNRDILERPRAGGHGYAAGWLPVALPCVGMVSAGVILRSLALGASAVGLIACGDGCSFGQEERSRGRVAFCQDLLRALGRPEQVRLFSIAEPSAEIPLTAGETHDRRTMLGAGPLTSLSIADAVLSLAEQAGSPDDLSVTHRYSPFGVVEIDADRCTGCAVCAERCPADALAVERDQDVVVLNFDATLCIACDLCTGGCPEEAVSLRRKTDLGALRLGKTVAYRDREARCEVCSAAIAPAAMLGRIEALLAGDGNHRETSSSAFLRRCPSCRVPGAGSRTA